MKNDPPAGTGNPKKNRSGSDKRQRDKITPVRWATEEFNQVAAKARTASAVALNPRVFMAVSGFVAREGDLAMSPPRGLSGLRNRACRLAGSEPGPIRGWRRNCRC